MICPDCVTRSSPEFIRRARPKSTITGSRRVPDVLIITFAGFRSRCRTPRAWASCIARASLPTSAAT